MTYDYLSFLKKNNLTIKLLNSDNFAMMVGFFYFIFVKKRYLTITHEEILSFLDDYLYDINQTYQNPYPKNAKDYLDDFVSDKNGYLKRYYGSDGELLYELTPYTQKALEFLESLQKKEFVGSRTKFNIIFELLEELMFETNLSDEERVKKLQEEKKSIDKQIEAIKRKEDLRFDSSRIKEHFMLIEETARKLKYDFSQIEYNFRDLNLSAMEQIASLQEAKDKVLSSIFDVEDSIRQSDQGKSFFAFWQILTDANKNEELSTMLEEIYKIKEIEEFDKVGELKNLKYDLLSNANKIAKVTSKLMEQLRRFLDDRVWVENKKILELCKSIEKKALEVKEKAPNQKNFSILPHTKVKIDSVFEKSLYTVKQEVEFDAKVKKESLEEIDLDSFYNLFFIDEEKLKSNINFFLQKSPQCSLSQIIEKFPIKKGVSEVISYLSIAKNSDNSLIMTDTKEKIMIEDENRDKKLLAIPKIIFTKGLS